MFLFLEREQEKDIQREQREKQTQLIPREEKGTQTTLLVSPLPGGGEGGATQVGCGKSGTHLEGGRR